MGKLKDFIKEDIGDVIKEDIGGAVKEVGDFIKEDIGGVIKDDVKNVGNFLKDDVGGFFKGDLWWQEEARDFFKNDFKPFFNDFKKGFLFVFNDPIISSVISMLPFVGTLVDGVRGLKQFVQMMKEGDVAGAIKALASITPVIGDVIGGADLAKYLSEVEGIDARSGWENYKQGWRETFTVKQEIPVPKGAEENKQLVDELLASVKCEDLFCLDAKTNKWVFAPLYKNIYPDENIPADQLQIKCEDDYCWDRDTKVNDWIPIEDFHKKYPHAKVQNSWTFGSRLPKKQKTEHLTQEETPVTLSVTKTSVPAGLANGQASNLTAAVQNQLNSTKTVRPQLPLYDGTLSTEEYEELRWFFNKSIN